ncbi:hypothetical protein [Pseudorhodoplanes sp.]|uniref:hypothetical protein n=1 Tax=Pseudorhodoplanes sp. TaxID=1934341 RepID=UPI002C7AFD36|nr:hypothetical protein [Pseudorhodoplanes sp.]HWV44099.1 hypothetical protein [Pseudorhodoplanes sp.]
MSADNYDLGKRHMQENIAPLSVGGEHVATNYALGALTAICCHCIAKHGPRYTYDLLQNMADQAASSLIERERRP